MKILMLNYEFPPIGGGAAPVTRELCRQLACDGHAVDVVTMHYRGLPRYEESDGFRLWRTPAIRKRPSICHTHEMASFLIGAIPRAMRLVRENRYDVIHCHFIIPTGPLGWMLSRRFRIPLLVTCHGSDVPGYNPDRFGVTHRLIGPAWRFLVRRCQMLVSPSQSLADLIHRYEPNLAVRVIPNGIIESPVTPAEKDKTIVLCSRLLPRKGFQYALAAVHDLDLDWQVEVIGDGPFRGELERIAAGSKTPVRFHGWLDQRDPRFTELYARGAIFVFPSESENFPSVLLEAMRAGMAIIASNAGGCPEVVGDAAMLVAPGDVEGIRKRIAELAGSSEQRRRLGEAALARVRQFGWPTVAGQYVRCYQEIVEIGLQKR
jgi:glycosyltransferase involved in cell wall biosynthesis